MTTAKIIHIENSPSGEKIVVRESYLLDCKHITHRLSFLQSKLKNKVHQNYHTKVFFQIWILHKLLCNNLIETITQMQRTLCTLIKKIYTLIEATLIQYCTIYVL